MDRTLFTTWLALGLFAGFALITPRVLTSAEDPVEKLLATNWQTIATKLKTKKEPVAMDLLIQGQTKTVELLEIDAANCLVYKAFGQKNTLAFTEATATQIAGILQAMVNDESETAAVEHLNIGLLYNIEGKAMVSANEINRAITLDSTLDQSAKEQLKVLPRPRQAGGGTAQAAAAALLNGADNNTGSAYKSTPQGTNHEGRQLGALPKFTQATLFNTPEADQIMAAMQVFPKNNPWNEDISKLPVLPESDKIVAHIGGDKHIHFNHDMNFVIVPPTQARIEVGRMQYKDESDAGPYPIPENTPIEGWTGGDLAAEQRGTGGDRHAVVVDPFNGLEYDFYQMSNGTGKWTCACEATFDLKTNVMRPLRWTSSDAAGLPLLPSIVRFDECERGMVEHALRFTVRQSRAEYIYPARHVAATSRDKDAPAMGQRFRLKASVSVPGLGKHAQAVLLALKKYGMFMADNGSDWYLSSTPDKRVTGLEALHVLKGSDFEVVQTTPETGAAGR
ncbi:MAG TPA: hypothetical protein VL860_04115 [Planctomycetota bacterium]|nr:hypothetical protein [Planctomycetota bacterium]